MRQSKRSRGFFLVFLGAQDEKFFGKLFMSLLILQETFQRCHLG